MSRLVRIALVAGALFMLGNPASAGAEADDSHPHVRTVKPHLRALLSAGVEISSMLRQLVAEIESSDVIAYVDTRLLTTPTVSAQSQFINASGGKRYVRVLIDARFSGPVLMGLLAHELQHVAEIAREPSVVDNRSLGAYYRRIGFRSPAGGTNRFESAAAIVTGRRVVQDALDHAADLSAAFDRLKQGEDE